MLQQRSNIALKVFYTWGAAAINKYDPGFCKNIEWDIPLLEGYEYCFVNNISAKPGSHHFMGIDNPTLINEIKSWGADAVLIYGWSFKSHLKCMRHFHKKIPVLFRGDSTLLGHNNFLKKAIRKISLNLVYRNADAALYAGQKNKAYFREYGMKEDQLIFAPHAIDNNRFMSRDADLNKIVLLRRQELNTQHARVVFLYAGKLDANKNVQALMNAILQLQNPAVHLLIAGNGATEDALKTRAGTAGNIHFLPFQNQQDMPVLYRMCDVFVLPSLSETWGLSINEAMACSRAVLVSDACGAATDLVKEGKNGYAFKSNNADSLLQKMKKLINTNTDLICMGRHSQEMIQQWNLEKLCKAVEFAAVKYAKA